MRNIVREGDDILGKRSRPVERFDTRLHELLDDMGETMAASDGVGLAAVQVGMLRRLFIINVGGGVIEFINPQILESSGAQTGPEGCLSCPGEWGVVTRPNFVRVRAQDRHGNWFEREGAELFARAVCHEYDHLDGIIFKTKAQRMLDDDELEEMGD